MSTENLFQFYLETYFKIPKELKNDVVYCQRALQAHIKVHQMVIDIFKEQKDADPVQKQRILEELENEILEINAEQNYILSHVRRVMDEFYILLKKNSIPIDQAATKAHISRELTPLISDNNVKVKPVLIQNRNSEEALIAKYFEVQEKENVFEILDSDEENDVVVTTVPETFSMPEPKQDMPKSKTKKHSSQKSLLKPMSERLLDGGQSSNDFTDPSQYLEMNLNEHPATFMNEVEQTTFATKSEVTTPALVQDSTTVKMSRLNLRKVLKKVEKENQAKVAARKLARTTESILPDAVPLDASSKLTDRKALINQRRSNAVHNYQQISPPLTASVANATLEAVKQVIEHKPKPVGRPPGSTKTVIKNSDSSDSNTERELTPPNSNFPSEPEDTRTLPDHCGKETFLLSFGLFTHEMHLQLQQRRSKRRRRCVQSNERADFHYGRIEYGSLPPPVEAKKKRREFLVSPQLKNKRAIKRRSSDKESTPSRSGSSSPDDKNCCNECLKGGGTLNHCQVCKGFYHEMCHIQEENDHENTKTKRKELKMCPACCRNTHKLRLEKFCQQNANLQSSVHALEVKYGKERSSRRATLQASNAQMRNLYKMVNNIRTEQGHSSSD